MGWEGRQGGSPEESQGAMSNSKENGLLDKEKEKQQQVGTQSTHREKGQRWSVKERRLLMVSTLLMVGELLSP